MCPGEFRYTSMAYIGQLTDQFISNFEIDVLFLAVEGIDLEFGVSVPDIVDGYTKTNLIQKAKKTICLVDSSKFKQKFLYKISDLKDIDLIITDNHLNQDVYQQFLKANISIKIVTV